MTAVDVAGPKRCRHLNADWPRRDTFKDVLLRRAPLHIFSVSHSNLINAGRPVDPHPPTPKQKLFGSTRFTWMTYFYFKTVNFTEWWQVCRYDYSPVCPDKRDVNNVEPSDLKSWKMSSASEDLKNSIKCYSIQEVTTTSQYNRGLLV